MATTTTPLQTARQTLAKIRGIERNERLGRYQGRNAVARDQHLTNLYGQVALAERELDRQLRGAIWAEHDLAERVSRARDNGQARPELAARLAAARRELR